MSWSQRDEEQRQSVIRKALLLGFECEEYDRSTIKAEQLLLGAERYSVGNVPGFRFTFEGKVRSSYHSIYAAAWDYLRLCGLPREVIGDFLG